MNTPRYSIVETSIGPMISESRTSVYDVMLLHDKGRDIYEISMVYNLTPLQMQTAVDYIRVHRATLELELKQILKEQAEHERYHRALAAERERIPLPMTSRRKAFYAFLNKNRQLQGVSS